MREMGEAAIRLSRAASGRTQAVDGLVRISATDLVAAWLLPGTLPGLHAAHPGIQIDIVAANDLSDLQRRVADIAIRHVRPTEPELVARLLGETPVHLYASSGYLDRVGRNPDPGAIDVIGFDGATAMVELLSAQGLTVEPRAVWLTSRSGLVGWAMARRGLGATIMAERIAERTPGMERIDIDLGYDPVPFWLVTHREVHTSRRVRIVYDHLAQTWPWAEGS